MATVPALSDESSSSDFELFFRANYAKLWRYVARRVPQSRADDVVSACFIVAWEKFSTIDSPSLAWLVRVASYQIANNRRKHSRDRVNYISIVTELPEPTRDDFDGSSVRSAIATLSQPHQEIVRLILWDEFTREEIAQILGLSVNAVNVRFHRALQKLERSIDLPRHNYPAKDTSNDK
jgi:RNA polymerase sigma-70 factor (ECF subfamily)